MREHVMLVCEDALGGKGIAAALHEAGYTCSLFEDPQSALDALDKLDQVDVLVTQVLFPGAAQGLKFARKAQRKEPRLRLVFIGSGRAVPHMEDVGQLVKNPAEPDAVVAAVDGH
jgi:DNA-binding NtrC family response regulator